jgi:integrase
MRDEMKPKGRHPQKALSAIKVKTTTEAGRHADGNGLYLVVDPSGAKRWMLRVRVQGRRRDIGLGGAQLVSLAEAREKAMALRKIARAGGDPLADRDRLVTPTFEAAALAAHQEHVPGWKNGKHANQWVDRVGSPEVFKVLSPIWLSKPETAKRVRQRIGTVLDWAKASGFRAGDNPVAGVVKGLPKHSGPRKHHATLPSKDLPSFVRNLRSGGASEVVRLAFEFLILTAARTSEVLEATWSEIKNEVWIIPADRMKGKREHRVPLSPRSLEILRRAKVLSDGSDYVFLGTSIGKPLSNTVFLMILRRMGIEATPHGFRSTFRDWAAETTSYPSEVCEAALAHAVRDKTEAAYRRGDLFEKRRELMADWAKFVTSAPRQVGAPARRPAA